MPDPAIPRVSPPRRALLPGSRISARVSPATSTVRPAGVFQVTFRKKIYETIEQLQIDLDQWIDYYNNERTHQGKVCEGRTPMQTLQDGKRIWKEKFVG